MDSKTLILHLDETLKHMPSALAGIEGADVKDGKLHIRYQPSKVSFQQVIGKVKDAGYSICDLSTQEAELEDIFRELTSNKAA